MHLPALSIPAPIAIELFNWQTSLKYPSSIPQARHPETWHKLCGGRCCEEVSHVLHQLRERGPSPQRHPRVHTQPHQQLLQLLAGTAQGTDHPTNGSQTRPSSAVFASVALTATYCFCINVVLVKMGKIESQCSAACSFAPSLHGPASVSPWPGFSHSLLTNTWTKSRLSGTSSLCTLKS